MPALDRVLLVVRGVDRVLVRDEGAAKHGERAQVLLGG
jgi:hypothetical protein